MRKIVFVLLFLTCAAGVSAQTIRMRSKIGGIIVTKGKMRSTIDLRELTTGCSVISAEYKRELDKKGCAATPAAFKLFDATAKNDQTFLIVYSEAADNCNVCGQCGATEAFTLFWLKLSKNMRLLEKKAVALEDCRANISLLGDAILYDESTNDQTLRLKFKNDILAIEFEEKIYNSNPEIENFNFSHLEYNRKTPGRGLIIKTEKREKSSAEEN